MTRPINYESGITLRPIIEQPIVAVVRRVSPLNLRLGLSSAQFLVVFPGNNLPNFEVETSSLIFVKSFEPTLIYSPSVSLGKI